MPPNSGADCCCTWPGGVGAPASAGNGGPGGTGAACGPGAGAACGAGGAFGSGGPGNSGTIGTEKRGGAMLGRFSVTHGGVAIPIDSRPGLRSGAVGVSGAVLQLGPSIAPYRGQSARVYWRDGFIEMTAFHTMWPVSWLTPSS